LSEERVQVKMNDSNNSQTILFIGAAAEAPAPSLLPDGIRLQIEPQLTEAVSFLRRSLENSPAANTLSPVLLLVGPEQDAITICRTLQENAYTAVYPIIPMLSDAAQRTAVLEAGAVDYLLTPLHKAEIAARIPLHATRRANQPAGLLSDAQEESHAYATQSAFLLLISRLLNEQLALPGLLDLALEQTAMLFNVSVGSIWLTSADGSRLELAAAITPRLLMHRQMESSNNVGLLGWAAQQHKPFALDLQAPPPWFDAEPDEMWMNNGRYLLIIPLYHHKLLGLILLHTNHAPFRKQDILLAEGAAASIAIALSNVTHLESLRRHNEEQQVLNEMSRELTDSLETETVLNRAVSWNERLCPAEYSLLWLVDDSQMQLRLAAATGLDTPDVTLNIGQGIVGRAAASARPAGIAAQQPDLDEKAWLQTHLHLTARNLLAIPVIYQGLAIGVILLINKIQGAFTTEDERLLSTASKMIAIALSNAAIYSRLQTLIDERTRLHQQAVQTARLAVVGRLTASLSHEINNPMQAIQGAMALALEELDDPVALREYIVLSQEQAMRVVQLVARLRQIYRPEGDKPSLVDLNALLQEVVAISHKELQRHKMEVQMELAPHAPSVWASADQLRLAFLNLTLALCDVFGVQDGSRLLLRSGAAEEWVWLEWETAVIPSAITAIQKILTGDTPKESGFGLMLCQDVIVAHGGELRLLQTPDKFTMRVELPV
jgi:GAF domain-containing protein